MIRSEVLNNLGIKPLGYKKIGNAVIINTKDDEYVVKKKKRDKKEIFDYLKSRSFNNFPDVISTDEYEITKYYESYEIPEYEKAKDLMDVVSILHTKTTSYKSLDIDDIKKIYEDLTVTIDELFDFYKNINDQIDEEIYMSPSHYLLARNISKIYSLLDFCSKELDSWYELKKDSEKTRVVLNHNNLDPSHFIRGDSSYLISWDYANIDSPIYDLVHLYKKAYNSFDFYELMNIYENRYPLNDYEKKLFFILISIPDKLIFTKNEYENTRTVNEMLLYIYKTDKIVLKYYSN